MSTAKKKTPTPVGECCPVLDLVTWRGIDARLGITCETGFNFKTGATYPAIIAKFRKAKRGEDGKFGYGSEYRDKTFAMLNFCPFCGTKIVRK